MNFASNYVLLEDKNDMEEVDVQNLYSPLSVSTEQQQPRTAQQSPLRSVIDRPNVSNGPHPQQPFPKLSPSPVPTISLPKAKVRKANTNLIAINLGSLETEGQMMTGDPIFCVGCGVAFNATSTLLNKTEWNCEFCTTLNHVNLDEEEMPQNETLDYLLEPSKEISESEKEELIIFCIDISGSMCVTTEVSGNWKLKGDKTSKLMSLNTENTSQLLPRQRRDVTYVSRLQCVQAAVETQLDKLAKEHPNAKVAIVCFNNEVRLLGDGSQEVVVVAGDKLNDYNTLLEIGKQYVVQKPIRESKETLVQKLFELEETGSTALGPAVVVCVGMALNSQFGGVKLVIATDGLSNTGIGALDIKSDEVGKKEARTFYEQLGAFAKLKGITISLISIRGEEVNLDIVGQLADQTDGTVDIVDPQNIHEQFGSILQSKLVATEVEVKLFLHRGLKFVTEDNLEIEDLGIASQTAHETNSKEPKGEETLKTDNNNNKTTEKEKELKKELSISRMVGNAHEDTELTFEFVVRSKEELENILKQHSPPQGANDNNNQLKDIVLPFQVQIVYRKLNGMKCVRIITKTKHVTTDRKIAEQTVDFELLGAHGYMKSATLAQKRNYEAAMYNNFRYQQLMSRNARDENQQRAYNVYSIGSTAFNAQLAQEKQTVNTTVTDQTSNMIYNYKSIKKAKQILSSRPVLPSSPPSLVSTTNSTLPATSTPSTSCTAATSNKVLTTVNNTRDDNNDNNKPSSPQNTERK